MRRLNPSGHFRNRVPWASLVACCVMIHASSGCKSSSAVGEAVAALEDPAHRDQAIAELRVHYGTALTTAGGNREEDNVQSVVSEIVPSVTRFYVKRSAELDPETRRRLLALLETLHDQRAEPAIRRSLESFTTNPEGTDIQVALRATRALELTALSPLVLQVFFEMHASTALGTLIQDDVEDTMLALAEPSWAEQLRPVLGAPLPRLAKDAEEDEIAARAQMVRELDFMQSLAAQLLGKLKDEQAIVPLVKLLLDPARAAVHPDAIQALAGFGPAGVAPVAAMMRGKNDELARYAGAAYRRHQETEERRQAALKKSRRQDDEHGDEKKEKKESSPEDQDRKEYAHLIAGARILGDLGHREGVTPLLDALESTDRPIVRASIASALAILPRIEASLKAFQSVFPSLSSHTHFSEKLELARRSLYFYQPDLCQWLADASDAIHLSGNRTARREEHLLRVALRRNVLLLAGPKQGALARKAIQGYGWLEDSRKASREVLDRCKDDAWCYLNELAQEETQQPSGEFLGKKAAVRIALLGGPEHAVRLVDNLNRITNPTLREMAARVIDHLSPKPSPDVVEGLGDFLDHEADNAPLALRDANEQLRLVLHRIEGRTP